MKNLFKLTVLVAILTVSAQSFAQDFGVKAGLNLSKVFIKDDDGNYSDDYTMNPGFHTGLTAEFQLTDFFSFETGLLLSTKGARVDKEEILWGETERYEARIFLYYLDVPFTAKAYFDVGKAKGYGVFGPYLGMGLSGKIASKYTYGSTDSETRNVNWGQDEEDDMKRMDYGLTVGAGAAIHPVQVGLTYSFGLANTSPVSANGYIVNNRVLGLSFGYLFGGK